MVKHILNEEGGRSCRIAVLTFLIYQVVGKRDPTQTEVDTFIERITKVL